MLRSRVEASPEKEFLFTHPDGGVFTYRDFDREVNRAARLLISLGVKKGERVSLFLTNRVEYLIFYFACFRTGAWAGPVNALLKAQEIEFIINDSQSIVAVTQPDLYARLAEANTPSLQHIIMVGEEWRAGEQGSGGAGERGSGGAGEQGDLERMKDEKWKAQGLLQSPVQGSSFILHPSSFIPPLHPHTPGITHTAPGLASDEAQSLPYTDISWDDEAVIIYTSGTTGKPKGVLLTHGNILSNARQIAEWLRLGDRDRALMIMPLFHVNALMTTAITPLWAGASLVMTPRFSASEHWNTISRYAVTYFGSVATMLSMLDHTYPDGVPEGLDTSRLRFALCGSAPVPVEVMKEYESLFHCPVVEGYGLSESTCRSTFNPPDARRRPGSVGLPIGNEIKIFDDDDKELGPGQVGEIVLRGSNIMKGYYRNEAATREAFRSGWFHTGDLGYRDEEGFFYVVDRKSDMIVRAGENIYPREIDEVLYQHPKVKDAATLCVKDALYGEEVKSFIVLRRGEQATEREIIDFCRERLADFKCPKTIEFLDDIPKGPTGKLLKRELAALSERMKDEG